MDWFDIKTKIDRHSLSFLSGERKTRVKQIIKKIIRKNFSYFLSHNFLLKNFHFHFKKILSNVLMEFSKNISQENIDDTNTPITLFFLYS
jgi:hypothetical protein